MLIFAIFCLSFQVEHAAALDYQELRVVQDLLAHAELLASIAVRQPLEEAVILLLAGFLRNEWCIHESCHFFAISVCFIICQSTSNLQVVLTSSSTVTSVVSLVI